MSLDAGPLAAGLIDPGLLAAGYLRCDVQGPVLTLTLDRPAARNAQTPATWRALAAVGAALPESVRVVVLRGAGESFSAGLDRAMFEPAGLANEPSLPELAGWPADRLDDAIAGFQRGFTWLARPELVSVAVVQGHAVGAGFQLALACDLRVLADDAKLAMRETSLGLVPDLAGTAPLVRAVGYSRALEICLTGRWVGAAEAAAIGLAEIVVRRGDLDATVTDLVAALLAPDAAAVRETKALLAGAQDRTPAQQQAAERSAQARRLRALAGTREAESP